LAVVRGQEAAPVVANDTKSVVTAAALPSALERRMIGR
jgi:hypothetical protein